MALSLNELVRIDSCLDPARADVVRIALAREEIPSAVGNANFLSWFWHYSNAVGGVPVYVCRDQSELARQVLAAARAKPADSLPPWICPSCAERVAGQWDVCWQCGHTTHGAENGHIVEDLTTQPEEHPESAVWWNVPRLFAVAASIVLVILLVKYGLKVPLMVTPFVLLMYFFLQQFERSSDRQPAIEATAEPSDRYAPTRSVTRSEVSRAIVRRAWQAGVLGAFAFPPLGFYSMRLLWKLGCRNTPLSWPDRWRCWTVFVLNGFSIILCLTFVGSLLAVLSSALR